MSISNEACFLVYHSSVLNEVFFAFVSPPKTSIRQRMMYAAARNQSIIAIEELIAVKIGKRFEVDGFLEIDELLIGVSQPAAPKAMFAKPARPGRK